MKTGIVAGLILAGAMSFALAEEGDADVTSPPVSPISLRPAEPAPAATAEPKVDVKAEPKAEPKIEPKVGVGKGEAGADEATEPRVPVKIDMPAGWDRYKVLVQRNMFSKERGRVREDSTRRERERKRDTPPPVPRIEGDLVLIGVVQRDGLPAAIIENRASGKIVTLKPGDSIGAGVVKVISLDSIDFENDAILHVIKIGTTLAGTPPKSTSSDTSGSSTASGGTALPSPATASTTPGTPAAPGSSGESVLERMKRKRQEELRK